MKPRILFPITLLCAAIANVQMVHAATITVINTNDSGAGSLRQALADANNGDTIDFSVTGTVKLTSGQLVVGSSVTVSGPGANQLTVQRSTDIGTPDFRVFYISSGKTVTISGLTITNGHLSPAAFPDDSGGGIYNDHGTLTVSNCTLSGNSAIWGGGIYNAGFNAGGSAALTVSNSTLSGNSSDQTIGQAGGGIYNDGDNNGSATAAISNSTLSSNSAPYGGGIVNDGTFAGNAALTVSNSTLSGNSASSFGGGAIYNKAAPGPPSNPGSATMMISTSTLSGNSASSSFGGGIYNEGDDISPATVTINNSTFSGNSAANGAGIYNKALAQFVLGPASATLTISNSTLSGNSASTSGGGIHNVAMNDESNARLTVTNSTFSGNSANVDGGGIYNTESFGNAAVTIGETILNGGASGTNVASFTGSVTSLGHNLSSDDSSAFLNATGDQNGTDPLLGPLQNNGGSTFTHALLTGSPAIDAGDPNIFTDQRGPGFLRVVNNRIDIGAFEVQSSPTPTPTPTPTATPRPHPTHPPHP